MEPKPRNDRQSAVTRFCLAMEELRRTEAGRVRTAKEMLDHFFVHDSTSAKDLLFVHMPREVRAPIVAGWGIRGAKAALRDDDERIRSVVHDALLAGDIDENAFEEGITPSILTDWVPLELWWAFWRSGKVTGAPVQKALAAARDLDLFDERWFLDNLEGRGGRLKGTDVLCDTLTKDQIIAWLRAAHASGDASPKGLLAALGWDTILAKTSVEALLFALDALAKKMGLVPPRPAGANASDAAADAPAPQAAAPIAPESAPFAVEASLAPARPASLPPPRPASIPAMRPASIPPPRPASTASMQAVSAPPVLDEDGLLDVTEGSSDEEEVTSQHFVPHTKDA